MHNANKALAERWFKEVWNESNPATIDELFSPEGKAYGFPEPGSVLIGPAAFKEVHGVFNQAFSAISIAVDEIIAEDDKVAVRWTAKMIHTGDALGFAATNLPVTFLGASIIHVKDGRIAEAWNFLDFTYVALKLQGKL